MAVSAIFFILTITTIMISSAITNPLSFNYDKIREGDVKLEGDAFNYNQQIEVTLKSRDKTQNSNYSVGRVTNIQQQMQLWDVNSTKLYNFISNFSFVLYSQEKGSGDGIAFFMANPNLPFLNNTIEEGGGFGLVDGDQVLNSTQYSFMAVEFDTYQNQWDPSGRHVGINFNSMNSVLTYPFISNQTKMLTVIDCSLEYNSASHNLSVSYAEFDLEREKVVSNYLSYKVDLREYLPERVIVGFSAVSRNFSQDHTLLSWSFDSSLDSDDQILIPHRISKKRNVGHSIGIGIGVAMVVSFIGLVCFLLMWKKWKKNEAKEEDSVCDLNMDDEFQKGIGPKKFLHNELVIATSNFSDTEKLGHGGFGGVYKGFIKDLNSYVAIKRISRESRQGIKEYATEVKIISQLRHRNLVQLLGWCHKKKDMLLIYEFMPNGSLDSHLYRGRKSLLTWEVRYNIVLDLASALLYLHEEWEQCVLHRDIKSSNIMLDSNFNAKLGDFGLARFVDHEKGTQTTHIAGTLGYIAPEYVTTGKASKESDIYSFGVVLMEIASGRKPIDYEMKEEHISIVEWVWDLYGMGKFLEAADSKLCGGFDDKQMECVVLVGIWCAHPDHSCRPSIRQVIQVLNFEAPLPSLPHKMPVPTFLPPSMNAIFSSGSSPNYVDTW